MSDPNAQPDQSQPDQQPDQPEVPPQPVQENTDVGVDPVAEAGGSQASSSEQAEAQASTTEQMVQAPGDPDQVQSTPEGEPLPPRPGEENG